MTSAVTGCHAQVRAGKRVLDVFSYIGAWGLQAAAAGASEVCCVDSAPLAQTYVEKNAAANALDPRSLAAPG